MTVLTDTQQTFRQELVRCRPQLRRCALALTRDPERAEDLVQDTIERALRFEHTYEPGSNLPAWLSRVMKNVFMSRCRRRSVETRALRRVALVEAETVHSPAEPWLSPRVARALDGLPEKIGQVVRLVDLAELSYGEAAGVLEIPVGTVMSRLHRGRKRLAGVLADGVTRLGEANGRDAEGEVAVHRAA